MVGEPGVVVTVGAVVEFVVAHFEIVLWCTAFAAFSTLKKSSCWQQPLLGQQLVLLLEQQMGQRGELTLGQVAELRLEGHVEELTLEGVGGMVLLKTMLGQQGQWSFVVPETASLGGVADSSCLPGAVHLSLGSLLGVAVCSQPFCKPSP